MNKKIILKITEHRGTEEETESYLHSTEGIVTFKDMSEAKRKAKSLMSFLNGHKNRKHGSVVIPVETKKPRSKLKLIPFRWTVPATFNVNG